MNILGYYIKQLLSPQERGWYYNVDFLSEELKYKLLDKILSRVLVLLSEKDLIDLEQMISKGTTSNEIVGFMRARINNFEGHLKQIMDEFESELLDDE